MITAREALKLPGAQLSSEDREKVRFLLARIEQFIRDEFQGGALRIQIPAEYLSPVITAEIRRECRRALWRAGWENQMGLSPITQQPTIVAQCLIIEPAPDAYDDAPFSVMDTAR